MSAGPLRRVVAGLGLVALAPIALMLIEGAIGPEEAARRAVAVALLVVALGNVARRVVASMLHRVERRAGDAFDGEPDRQQVPAQR